MDGDERLRLEEVMEKVAAGDAAAPFALITEFGGPLRAAVRRACDHLGVRLSPDDVDEVLKDVVLALAEVAPSWRPDGGALPWVWGEKRVLAAVSRFVGQHHDQLDDEILERRAGDDGPDGVLAHVDVDVREVLTGAVSADLAAVRTVAEDLGWQKMRIFLEYVQQQASGDPSPAHTVATLYGSSPAAVRKTVQRARKRVAQLIAEDVALAVLADTRLVA
jgi:hypothetical protein